MIIGRLIVLQTTGYLILSDASVEFYDRIR